MTDAKNTSDFQKTGILITLLAAAFITSMSTTVTGNMIPNFTAYFGISSGLAQWLTSGATLLSGITIPITAFLIKRTSNKTYFFSAMAAYALGSFCASISFNFPMLLVSRLLQAVGCGMLLSFAQIVLLKLYPKEKHGTIMVAYSMSATVSSVIDPTYAGLIMDTFGWRGVFVSLFVVGAIIIIAGLVFMKNVTDKENAEINILYVALSSLGFAAFLIGVNNLSNGLFSLTSGGMILAGLLLLAIFAILQLKYQKPMLNLRIFKYSTFRISVVLSMCLYLISMGSAMVLPIFTKTICGYSDTAYGLATTVGAVLSVFITLLAGKSYDKFGIKPMFLAGTGMFAIFSALGLFFSDSTPILFIAFVNACQSVAMAALISPSTTMALSGLSGQERVDGSAIYNTLRQISSSLASTLSVLIFTMAGSNISAVHVVYCYFLLVTVIIAILIILYFRSEKGYVLQNNR